MQVPSQVFREYDIRGVAERDLSSELAQAIGRGYARMVAAPASGARASRPAIGARASRPAIGAPARIAVGRDCRISSPRLHQALVDGLLRSGVHVIDVGVGPTPMLYFAVHHLNADGGIMITGSHNPADENGFKMMRGKGSFFGADIQALRKRIEAGDLGEETSGGGESCDVKDAYVTALTKGIKMGSTGMKVVVDAGNGAGGPLGLAAMGSLGLSPEPLFCDMDGRFPNHHPDPTVPKNLEALIARVRQTGARVGIAYDGDADRLGAVDANGDIVWGDRLMILFSRALLNEHPGASILGEVKCSQTLYDDIAKRGGRPILWKTGHSLIKTKMKETGALLAGEMSGHLFFADRYFGFDDALYASLRLLEILSNDPRTIGEMLADVPKTFTTPEIRVDCPDAIKFAVVKAITQRYKAKGFNVIDIDGARIQVGTPSAPAWGLVRASNTGPILVMRFEARTERERDRLRRDVEAAVAEERARLK
jgi:phosphomannomutase/phosphoglucomutase